MKLGGSGEVFGWCGLWVMLPMKDNQNQIDLLPKGQQIDEIDGEGIGGEEDV